MKKTQKIDYRTTCWSCKGTLMEDKGEYVQCRSCGATWNPVVKLGAPIITYEKDKFDLPICAHSIPIYERRSHKEKEEDLG
jgi:hypothetical protein